MIPFVPDALSTLGLLADTGANVTAQDVPATHPVELNELLASEASVQ